MSRKNLLEAKKNGYIIPYALLEKTQDLLKKIQKIPNFRLERLEKMSLPNAKFKQIQKNSSYRRFTRLL